MKPTEEYAVYQQAFDYFNGELFGGRLPACLITLQRRRNARGYFWEFGIAARHNQTLRTDEIALNPDTFGERDDKEILSTLVHEICHLWQAHEGKPGRGGYHNRQWAREMMRIGLCPISFDQPGKMTGQRVSHEIVAGGAFDVAADRLLSTGFRFRWQSAVLTEPAGTGVVMPEVVKRNKVKFSCPECEQNAWGAPTIRLICGRCQEPMTRQDRDYR